MVLSQAHLRHVPTIQRRKSGRREARDSSWWAEQGTLGRGAGGTGKGAPLSHRGAGGVTRAYVARSRATEAVRSARETGVRPPDPAPTLCILAVSFVSLPLPSTPLSPLSVTLPHVSLSPCSRLSCFSFLPLCLSFSVLLFLPLCVCICLVPSVRPPTSCSVLAGPAPGQRGLSAPFPIALSALFPLPGGTSLLAFLVQPLQCGASEALQVTGHWPARSRALS